METRSETYELLERIPLFAGFGSTELDAVASCFTEVGFRRGGTVCVEGEPGEHFYVIASGELEVWSGGDERRLLQRMGAGDFFGEMSLLLGWRRTATVIASRPARLLALSREDFERHLLRSAPALEAIARELAARLAARSRGQAPPVPPTIGVTAGAGLRGASLVASGLSALLRELSQRPVLRIRLQTEARLRESGSSAPLLTKLASEGGDALRAHLEPHRPEPARLELALRGEEGERSALRAVIEQLRERFSYVVVDFEALPQVPTELCDLLIRVEADPVSAEGERATQALPVINLANGQSSPVPLHHCEPYVIPHDSNLVGLSSSEQGRYLVANPRSISAPPLYRLTRKILGRTVGLALGGGAAYGVASIGVLRVLESEGIPVDLIAGTSMGSVIALAYASGASPSMMAQGVRAIGSLRALPALLDFTFTRPGLLAGDRVARLLAPLMGGSETFSDLIYPCRAVAADIETGERVQLTEGRLVDAFRASSAVPMVWSPVERDGRLLVDGGMNDPVPAGVVHEMGADVCIAVNVVPPPRKGVTNQLGRAARRLRKLNPISRLAGTENLPNSFEVVVNAIQGLQHELGNFKAISADVRIHPELSEFAWTDFHRSEELIERGAEAADRSLAQIRRAIAERGPAPWADDRV